MIGYMTCVFTLLLISGILFCGETRAATSPRLELNSIMMRNTYKITGESGYMGSCFLIGKPLKDEPKRAAFVLVTAAHVFENMKGEEATIYFRRKKEDIFEKVPWKIKIREKNDKGKSNDLWVKNKSGLDIAVMYVSLPPNVDTQLLPTSMLADDEVLTEFEIHPGDEMFCLGFPLGLEANKAGFPILRSGKVASFPLIPTRKYSSFLLDFQIYGGNSGGPVYFVESNRNYGGGTHIGTIQFIAGLVSQEKIQQEVTKSLYETKQQTYSLKIAVIINASHILETINQLPEFHELESSKP